MSKKQIGIIISVILVIMIGYFAVNFYFEKFSNEEDDSELENDANNQADFSEFNYLVFTGDEGYLLKGKLLDKTFEKEFTSLPDTLYKLEFDDRIFEVSDDTESTDLRYSLIHNSESATLDAYERPFEQQKLISYLRLAIKGAVEYPSYSSPENIYNSLIPREEFESKFKDYFSSKYDTYGISSVPYDVKQKLIAFYESDEGKNYRYKLKGEQTSADLMWGGELTGKDKNEIAILLNNTESKLDDRYILLVYATKNIEYEKNKTYYLVYNETFYDRVLLGHIRTSSDGESYVRQIYKNSDVLEEIPFNGIVLKRIDQPDQVLVYDREFDKMVKYLQVPKSKQEVEDY